MLTVTHKESSGIFYETANKPPTCLMIIRYVYLILRGPALTTCHENALLLIWNLESNLMVNFMIYTNHLVVESCTSSRIYVADFLN